MNPTVACNLAEGACSPDGSAAIALPPPRHPRWMRITHWLNLLSFTLLVVSGFAILLAHPRFYWGESGHLGLPALLELPFALDTGHSAWGRNLHFFGAWLCVVNGGIYVFTGLLSGYFHRKLLPSARQLSPGGLRAVLRGLAAKASGAGAPAADNYNGLQKITYLGVIFGLFPLVILTGLGMSPAVVTVLPWLATVWGGHQSARFVHFIVTDLLLLFLAVHLLMVALAGFKDGIRAMTTGRRSGVTPTEANP